MYGIADLDNCHVSYERVFRPDLQGVPCVVLSNNDGCIVARSNEAKKMSIKEGTPYFQLAQQYTKKDGKGKADVFANAIKHDFKSPNPTTRWGDIMKLNVNAKKKEK